MRSTPLPRALLSRRFRAVLLVAAMSPLGSCASWGVAGCHEPDGKVLGEDVPRIRSSHVRMKLADPAAAAARFAPYAILAALAYENPPACNHRPEPDKADVYRTLKGMLDVLSPPPRDWKQVKELSGKCEDELGLFYDVWKRESADAIDVVLAFRGTSGKGDWGQANLRWATRFFTSEDQYDRSRKVSREVVRHFKAGAQQPRDGKPVRFFSTGHSLGGGLAQNVLYDLPNDYLQAFAFNPSPVTGYMDQEKDVRRAGCECRAALDAEARIYRFYESYEILAGLRFALKLVLAPNRHIHEVRFGFDGGPNPVAQHSMSKLAAALFEEATSPTTVKGAEPRPWYAGIGDGCTEQFRQKQLESCAAKVETCSE